MGDTLVDVLQGLEAYEQKVNKESREEADEMGEDWYEDYEISMLTDGSFYDDSGFLFKWDLKHVTLAAQSEETLLAIQNLING